MGLRVQTSFSLQSCYTVALAAVLVVGRWQIRFISVHVFMSVILFLPVRYSLLSLTIPFFTIPLSLTIPPGGGDHPGRRTDRMITGRRTDQGLL